MIQITILDIFIFTIFTKSNKQLNQMILLNKQIKWSVVWIQSRNLYLKEDSLKSRIDVVYLIDRAITRNGDRTEHLTDVTTYSVDGITVIQVVRLTVCQTEFKVHCPKPNVWLNVGNDPPEVISTFQDKFDSLVMTEFRKMTETIKEKTHSPDHFHLPEATGLCDETSWIEFHGTIHFTDDFQEGADRFKLHDEKHFIQ